MRMDSGYGLFESHLKQLFMSKPGGERNVAASDKPGGGVVLVAQCGVLPGCKELAGQSMRYGWEEPSAQLA